LGAIYPAMQAPFPDIIIWLKPIIISSFFLLLKQEAIDKGNAKAEGN